MCTQVLKLDALPIEIIRRIAACGPCESVLALLKVNRALYRACNDRLVFKSILVCENGPSSCLPEWACSVLSLQSPISWWARYTLADSRISQFLAGLMGSGSTIKYTLLDVAPQLMALHHKIIYYENAFKLIENLSSLHGLIGQDARALSFCLAALVIASGFEERKTNAGFQNLRSPSLTEWRVCQKLVNTLSRPVHTLIAPVQEALTQKQTLALKVVATFSFQLRLAISHNLIVIPNTMYNHPTMRTSVYPPSTSDIPFQSFMDLPLPFWPNATEHFGSCHLPIMTSPEFLEDGEWVGYYCISMPRQEGMRFDLPMTAIRLVATTRNSMWRPRARKLDLSATGSDGIGTFHLNGEIDTKTGDVNLRKQYNNGVAWGWDWVGVMTPFGIVGSWGEQRWGGWFWLWKSTWSNIHGIH